MESKGMAMNQLRVWNQVTKTSNHLPVPTNFTVPVPEMALIKFYGITIISTSSPMFKVSRKVVRFQYRRGPLMSCTPILKAMKPVWAKQLAPLCFFLASECDFISHKYTQFTQYTKKPRLRGANWMVSFLKQHNGTSLCINACVNWSLSRQRP